MQIIKKHCHGAAEPPQRIPKADVQKFIGDIVRHGEKIDLPNADKAGEHDNHRGAAVARSPQRGGKDLIDRAAQIKRRDDA